MTVYSPLNHYVMVTGIGECIRAELADTTAGVPDRLCVVPGDVAWDACECGQLAISTVRIFPSREFPIDPRGAVGNAQCGTAYLIAEVLLSMTRCVPIPDDAGNAPPCPSLANAAKIMYEDADAVFRGTMCCLKAFYDDMRISDFAVQDQTFVGPAGRCAGSELRVLIGYTPNVCC